jgi:DNA primase
MARCPFHDDHNPSMKIDNRFHCFACGADGDVIDYTGKLFGLSPYDAARKLAADFDLGIDKQANTAINNAEPPITERFCIFVLWRYLRLLRIWQVRYAPKLGDALDERFVESLKWTDTVWDYLDNLQHRTLADAEQTMKILTEGGLIMKLNDYVTRKEKENGIIGR